MLSGYCVCVYQMFPVNLSTSYVITGLYTALVIIVPTSNILTCTCVMQSPTDHVNISGEFVQWNISDNGTLVICLWSKGFSFLNMCSQTKIFVLFVPLNGWIYYCDCVTSYCSVGCKHLEHLDLSNCPRITADGIKILASGCKSLRTLILEYCQEVNDVALEMIALHCAGLLHLNIRHCSVSMYVMFLTGVGTWAHMHT